MGSSGQLLFQLLPIKAKIKGVLAGHTVAMVTYVVSKIIAFFFFNDWAIS